MMNVLRLSEIKALLGVLILDLPGYLPLLWATGSKLTSVCNRRERLVPAPDGSGYRCDWKWTSELWAPKVLPKIGHKLMIRALADHPIRRLPQPENSSVQPEVSFIIGHRGVARLPHLLTTIESIAAQEGVSVECIVVEQEFESHLGNRLPAWVRHVHTPPPTPAMPYCRSWAFNIGVKHARGAILVLHDNDMLVPVDYAAQIQQRVKQGFEVINLKRFIFYLSESHTRAVFTDPAALLTQAPDTIVQNLEGGGSVAITPDAYERIGSMDESFIGWGGEDNEFWERAQICNVWPFGYLPIVHLWHPLQPGKYQNENPTLKHYRELSAIPVDDRIKKLRGRTVGELWGHHPVGTTVTG